MNSEIEIQNRNKIAELFPEIMKNGTFDVSILNKLLGVTTSHQNFGLLWQNKNSTIETLEKPSHAKLSICVDKSLNFETTQHILIEGDNLEAMKLLEKTHKEKIKVIYIDPPYNTGKDSVYGYSDKFKQTKSNSKKTENINLQLLFSKNTDSDALFHSSWLNMIYPRMVYAHKLLANNGIMFVSIDDNEAFNLKLLLDEIFGSQNFVGEFIWHNRTTPNDAGIGFATDHEFILIYAKNKTACKFKGIAKDFSGYKNPDNDSKGDWIADNPSAASGNESYRFAIENPFTGEIYYPPQGRYWAFSPKRVEEWAKTGKLVFPKVANKNFVLKKYKSELRSQLKPISSILTGILTSKGTKEMKELFEHGSPFKYPKPTDLIKILIEQTAENNDIVLDFFAGSGSTGHAVYAHNFEHKTNVQFVCIQINEEYSHADKTYNDQFKVVSDITHARLIKSAQLFDNLNQKTKNAEGLDFGFRFFKVEV